jgi:hypothetical protein
MLDFGPEVSVLAPLRAQVPQFGILVDIHHYGKPG